MTALAFFEHPLWSRLAAMHLHFLWQGLLIACLYWAVVKLFNIGSARLRYLLGMSGLAAMMLATIATFWLAEVPKPRIEPIPQVVASVSSELPSPSHLPLGEKVAEGRMRGLTSPEDLQSEDPLTLTLSPQGRGDKADTLTLSSQGRGDKSVEPASTVTLQQPSSESQSVYVPLLLGAWFLGVMIFGLRLLGGVGTVVWWRWSSLGVTDPYWIEQIHRLSRELGLARPPRLAVSFRANDAFSLGLFRPLIVLPAAWLLKLPPEALENVLAHELAHIRRFDAWANLFQRVLEAWLFYHPAVWWLSRQMEEEREKCTDLKAVSLTGDRLQYVKTLAGIAEYQLAARLAKPNGPILATGMGGKNMVLLERVRHILGETPRTGAASRFLAGTMVLAIPMALWVGTLMLPTSAADEGDAVVAQADDEREDGQRAEGDRDRPEGERRDGDRPRPEGEQRDGDRPRPEGARDSDRPRPEGQRDGDRPRPDGQRDGDRPRPEGARDGDRRPDGPPREGDRRPDGPREGDRPRGEGEGRTPVFPPRGLPGAPGLPGGPPRFRDGEGRGEGGPGPQGELIELIRELRREVEQLRQEVRELREGREGSGPRPAFRRPGGDFRPDGQQGVRPPMRRPDGERGEGDRPDARPEGDRPDARPEGDRPDARRSEGEDERPRVRVIERRQEIRREGDRVEESSENRREANREEGADDGRREALEEAREADRPQGEGEADRPERESADE